METDKVAEYKMKCLEMAERISPKNSDVLITIAAKLYSFLDITYVNPKKD